MVQDESFSLTLWIKEMFSNFDAARRAHPRRIEQSLSIQALSSELQSSGAGVADARR
jgi:hypothetical protein